MRVKSGFAGVRRHRKLLKLAKGYRLGRKNVYSVAKNAVMKAGMYAYEHRKAKKRDYRKLWIARISAALKEMGYNYSTVQHALTTNMVLLNRKVLSNMAIEEPSAFRAVVEKVMK